MGNEESEDMSRQPYVVEARALTIAIPPVPSDATPQEQADRTIIEEFESAIKRSRASFARLAEAHFGRYERDPLTRSVYSRYFPQILGAFEAHHGGISKAYWCKHTKSGAVLTETNELHMDRDVGIDAEVEDLLFQCDKVNIAARHHLRERDPGAFKTCMERLYYVTTDLLGILDIMADAQQNARHRKKAKASARKVVGAAARPLNPRARFQETLKLRRQEIGRIEALYAHAAGRRAQREYFVGMVQGVCFLAVIIALAGVVLLLASVPSGTWAAPIGCAIAGGAGAVVSVMMRMHRDRLLLDYEADPDMLKRFGAFRPIIGSVVGTALFALITSGLLPISVPTDPAVLVPFYSGISFLAGFSERWAQDMLVATTSRVGALAIDKGPPEETQSQ